MKKTTLKTVILWLAVLAAVLVPCLTLFQEGDWLSYVIRDSAQHKEWLEIGILAAVLTPVCLFLRDRKILLGVLLGMLLVVSYLHSMLIPLLLAGLWFTVIMLTGDPVTGIALTIVIAGGLSLIGKCTPLLLAATTLAVSAGGTFLRAEGPSPLLRSAASPLQNIKDNKKSRLLLALIMLVLFVQIGRANECIDFDSLWYGVRSSFVLNPNGNIFEDLGLVGMVYTYPKGFEILTLPLNITESYAVISAFNLFLFVYGLFVTKKLGDRFTGGKGGLTAVLLTVLVPGIVNMTLSAKPDIITWLLQLIMLERFFAVAAPEENEKKQSLTNGALSVISVYLLSLTMKPTALIFSTALVGMMFLWTLYRRFSRRDVPSCRGNVPALHVENDPVNRSKTGAEKHSATSPKSVFDLREGRFFRLLFSAMALLVVWGRTFKLTGMPFTSVFTGILEKLGFTMKYPFSSRSLPQSWQEGSQLVVALKRAAKILLSPDGKDMSHVIIAWGGSLFFVLGVMILWNLIQWSRNRRKGFKPASAVNQLLIPAALTVFLPFIVTSFVTLMMLYQVDGNYYMTLYSIVILLYLTSQFSSEISRGDTPSTEGTFLQHEGTSLLLKSPGRTVPAIVPAAAMAVILAFQFVMMTMTNWAGVTGFTKIQANNGLFSHRAYYEQQLTETDGSLYRLLSADPSNRVVAFGEHPTCLQFPCIVQSYNDITSPWGNVEIVNTADAFIDYLHFAKVNYVYGDAAHLLQDAWQWSKGLIDEMTARGVLTDFIYEGENWVAKVN